MPNRIIREGILTSERVNKLAPQAELFYRRLMSVVDDYGRFTAHPGLLRSACYPLRVDEVREADITRWLADVQLAGLIALYAVAGKGYLEMIDFRQQVRAKESRFPAPVANCIADATQVRADAHLDGDVSVVEDEGVDGSLLKCAADLYSAYPRKVGKGKAMKAIRLALKKTTFDVLREAVVAFAKAREGQDQQFTPYPATWFNEERWNDDRREWSRTSSPVGGPSRANGPARVDPTVIHAAPGKYDAYKARPAPGGQAGNDMGPGGPTSAKPAN